MAKIGFFFYVGPKSSVVAAWSIELRRILRFSRGLQERKHSGQLAMSAMGLAGAGGWGPGESECQGVGRLSEMCVTVLWATGLHGSADACGSTRSPC